MTSLYMLDTDTCAFILRRSSRTLLKRIQAVSLERQAMSIVTRAEPLYGLQLSSRKKDNRAAVDALAAIWQSSTGRATLPSTMPIFGSTSRRRGNSSVPTT